MPYFFSILVPAYNAEQYIADCLTSVLRQTYSDFEVILINDGSTDRTGIICKEFADGDARIRLYTQANQGVIMARRFALEKATGDIIIFLDADDFWETTLLATVAETFSQYQCDLVIFQFRVLTNWKPYISPSVSLFHEQYVFCGSAKEILFRCILNSSELNHLCNKPFRRNLIDKSDYSKYAQMKNSEDLLQLLPILYNAQKIVFLSHPLYNYRMVNNSASNTFNIHHFEDVTITRSTVLDYLRKLNFDTEENLHIFFRYYLNLTKSFAYRLAQSNLPDPQQLAVLSQFENNDLVSAALTSVNRRLLPWSERFWAWLLDGKKYQLMLRYQKLVLAGRPIKKFFMLLDIRINLNRLLNRG